MTRSQKYDVNNAENAAVNGENSVKAKEDYSFQSNASTKPVLTVVDPLKPKRTYVPWVALILVGVCVACFLGFMYGSPNSPIHLRGPKASYTRNLTVQGSLVLYPQIPDFKANNRAPHEYFISLDDKDLDFNYDSLLNVTSGYPHHAADQPPPDPYVHCWLETPSPQRPCFFDKGWLGRSCLASNRFGYSKQPNESHISPCFMVRLENSGSWTPDNWSPDEVEDPIRLNYDPSFVGLRCQPLDARQHHVTVVQNPVKGFPLPFFPISAFDSATYLLPAVMLRVYGIRPNENVTIECFLRVWDSYHLVDTGRMLVTLFHPAILEEIDPRESKRVGAENDVPTTTTTTTPVYTTRVPQTEATTDRDYVYYSYGPHSLTSSKLEITETEPIQIDTTTTEDYDFNIAS